MTISNLKINLMNLFNISFIIVMTYIIYNTIRYPSALFYPMKCWVIVLGSIILILGLMCFYKFLNIFSQRSLKYISILSFLILLGLQLFFAYYFKVNPTWDFGKVYNEAIQLSIQFRQLDKYFYLYCPNNLPILLLLTGLFKIFRIIGFNDMLIPLILFNLIIVFLSVIILYLLIKELYGQQYATLFSVICFLITPFYTYTTIVYTDTLGMILPISSLYLYVKIYRSNDFKNCYLIFLGFILGIGGLLKTHALILFIAMLIHYCLTKNKKIITFSSTLISVVLIVMISYKVMTKPLIPVPSSEVGFPKTHWIMMGLSGLGGFDDDDTNMTRFLKDSNWSNQEIQSEHLRLIKQRIKDFGMIGLINHLNHKLNFTWSDGTYFAPEKLKREPIDQNLYQEYVFGNKNEIYVYLSQTVHVVILFLMWIGSFSILKSKINLESVMTLTVFGLILFLLIWETRSRYLLIYLPVFVLLASFGFKELMRLYRKI